MLINKKACTIKKINNCVIGRLRCVVLHPRLAEYHKRENEKRPEYLQKKHPEHLY